MTITRRNAGSGHSYTIDGAKVPGVTTILGDTLPKHALKAWAARTAGNYAGDSWDELAALPLSKRVELIRTAPDRDRDAMARRGNEVHALGAALAVGDQVEVPDELAGHVDSYVDFLNVWEPTAVLVETVVGNRAVGYCGTLDLVADMRGERWLLDLKTGRSGIFTETALQLCAYGRAEVYLQDDQELPMDALGITRAGAVHVRADGWDLYPVEVGDQVWRVFQHLAWIQRQMVPNRWGRMELPADWVGKAVAS